MRATFPIITCDSEDGCDQWTLDWYSALASNWRSLMAPGWRYDPYRPDDDQLCPEHAAEADAEAPAIPAGWTCRCAAGRPDWTPDRGPHASWCEARDPHGRPGTGPFCEETWLCESGRFLVCQRGPRHVAEGRPHKDTSGLIWSDEERAAGCLR